jgi:D-alanine-D-alanine ligase
MSSEEQDNRKLFPLAPCVPYKESNSEKWPFDVLTVVLPDPRLDQSYYEYWIPQDDIDSAELYDALRAIPGIKQVVLYDNHRALLEEWRRNPPQFVFNQADDGFMNEEEMEVHVCAYLDMLGVPYTGPGPTGIILTKDKAIVRGAAMSIGVPVPFELYIPVGADLDTSIPDDLPYPVFAKLGNASGSTGILGEGLAKNRAELLFGTKKLRDAHPTRPILIQEFLNGREISVAAVGNQECGDFEVFHPVEVDYSALSPQFARVQLEEFKRDGDSQFWQEVKEIKADLSEQQLADIKRYVQLLTMRLGVKDFCRIDMRMDRNGVFKVMDVNPNCWVGGKYRMMAAWSGYSTWSLILARIFRSTLRRYEAKRVETARVKAIQEARARESIAKAAAAGKAIPTPPPK